MNSILRDTQKQLWSSPNLKDRARSCWLSIREIGWRLTTGRTVYFIAFGAFVIASWGFLHWTPPSLHDLSAIAKGIAAVLSLAGTVWTGILAMTRSLLSGSAASARSFLDSAKDPYVRLKEHFSAQIRGLKSPVAVLIDDLDRCGREYVVALLEGVQTLMREAHLTYVVASDRRWLCTCFDVTYSDFAHDVNEPGRPLGYLFLEKTFQVSTSVPRLDPIVRSQFWDFLIGFKDSSSDLSSHREKAKASLASARSEEDVLDVLSRSNSNPSGLQALRLAAVERLLSEELATGTEHRLHKFADLVEPNPRSMKRFVNAYLIQRTSNMLAGGLVSPELLALWTILLLRWPLVGEYLQRHPEQADLVQEKTFSGPLPDIIQCFPRLLQDTDFLQVLSGVGGAALTKETILLCAGLRPSATSGPAVA